MRNGKMDFLQCLYHNYSFNKLLQSVDCDFGILPQIQGYSRRHVAKKTHFKKRSFEERYTKHTCACGDAFNDTTVPKAANHTFTDGVCSCGVSEAMLAALIFTELEDSVHLTKCDTAFEGEMVIPAYYNGKPVTYIGAFSFRQCAGITSVTMPETVTEIGQEAFSLCSSLAEINFSDNITTFGKYAFSSCTALTSIKLPKNLVIMKTDAFFSCTGLITTTYENCNYLGSEENPYLVLYSLADTSVTSYTIHPDTKVIYDYVFTHNKRTDFNTVEIPEGVTCVGDKAFNVHSFFEVNSVPSSLLYIGNDCFNKAGNGYMYNYSYKNSYYLGNEENKFLILMSGTVSNNGYVVNENTKFIYDYAFQDKYELQSITMHDDIISIGKHAFHNCYKLQNVELPSSITELREYTFYMDRSYSQQFRMDYIVIPESVNYMDWNVFESWTRWGMDVFFEGTETQWSLIDIDKLYNNSFANAYVSYLSEKEPALNADSTDYNGSYWYYSEGTPTKWIYTPDAE